MHASRRIEDLVAQGGLSMIVPSLASHTASVHQLQSYLFVCDIFSFFFLYLILYHFFH